jgi:MFS family permease
MLAASLAPWFARRGIHYGWVMVALTFATVVVGSGATGVIAILVLPLSAEFGWSRGEIAGPFALMVALFGGIAPFAGALLLRYGLRRVVAASAILSVLALGSAAWLMTSLWQLWLTFGLLQGVAGGLTALVLSATVANRWFSQRRGLVVGILAAAMATGQLVFLPTNAWLVANLGWRIALMPGIVGGTICAVLYLLLARDWPAEIGIAPYGETAIQKPAPASAGNVVAMSLSLLREASRVRAFWVIAGTFFVCGLSTSGTVQPHFIPLCADFGVTPVAAASVLAMMGMFNFVGTIGSGWLSDRFDSRKLLGWYYGLRGLSLMWLPFSGFDMVSLTVFAVFFGLDYIATIPPTVKLAAQHFGPAKGPIVFGWAFAAHQLGGAAAALATGVSRDALASYLPAFFAAGVSCFIAVAAVFALRDIRRLPVPVAAE